jgi:hypothetical protein
MSRTAVPIGSSGDTVVSSRLLMSMSGVVWGSRPVHRDHHRALLERSEPDYRPGRYQQLGAVCESNLGSSFVNALHLAH